MNTLYGLQQGRAYNKIQTSQLNNVSKSQVNKKRLQETSSPSLGYLREGLENMSNNETEELLTLFNKFRNEFNTIMVEYKKTLEQYFNIQKNGKQMTTCPPSYTPYGDGSACKDKENRKCALHGNTELARCSNIQVCPPGFNPYGDGSACENTDNEKCALWGNEKLSRCPIETYMITADRDLTQKLEDLNGKMVEHASILYEISNQLKGSTSVVDAEYENVRNELIDNMNQLEEQRIEFKNTDFHMNTLSKQLSDIKLEAQSNSMRYGVISIGVILLSIGIYHGLKN